MIKVNIELSLERYIEPDNPEQLKNLLWKMGVDLSDGSDIIQDPDVSDILTLLRLIRTFESNDTAHVTFSMKETS